MVSYHVYMVHMVSCKLKNSKTTPCVMPRQRKRKTPRPNFFEFFFKKNPKKKWKERSSFHTLLGPAPAAWTTPNYHVLYLVPHQTKPGMLQFGFAGSVVTRWSLRRLRGDAMEPAMEPATFFTSPSRPRQRKRKTQPLYTHKIGRA